MHHKALTPIIRIIAVSASILTTQACDTVKESVQVKKEPSDQSLRLTIVAPRGYQQNTTNNFLVKASDSKSRALLRKEDTDTFTLYILDETLSQLNIVTPKPEDISGLYQFSFTPKAPAYRVWAEVTPSGNEAQYPFEDIGAKAQSKLKRTQNHQARHAKMTYELMLSKPLKKYNTTKMHVLDTQTKTALPIIGITGFYDDFRHMYQAVNDDTKIAFTPQHTGFVKLFVRVKTSQGNITLPFTSEVIK